MNKPNLHIVGPADKPQRPLKPYHLIWLAVHPTRTETWLRAVLADGFHIHHLDGDHENNDPRNLALIEGDDHLMIHSGGRPVRRGFLAKRGPTKRRPRRPREPVAVGPVPEPEPDNTPALRTRPVTGLVSRLKPGRRDKWVKKPGRKL